MKQKVLDEQEGKRSGPLPNINAEQLERYLRTKDLSTMSDSDVEFAEKLVRTYFTWELSDRQSEYVDRLVKRFQSLPWLEQIPYGHKAVYAHALIWEMDHG